MKTNTSTLRETNGPKTRANALNGTLFVEGETPGGIPHNETVEWLQGYTHGEKGPNSPLNPKKAFILIGDETAPEEIWESLSDDPENNCLIHSEFQRIWQDPEIKNWEVTISAKITKTFRVTGRNQEEAGKKAHQLFNTENEFDKRYTQDIDKAVEVPTRTD